MQQVVLHFVFLYCHCFVADSVASSKFSKHLPPFFERNGLEIFWHFSFRGIDSDEPGIVAKFPRKRLDRHSCGCGGVESSSNLNDNHSGIIVCLVLHPRMDGLSLLFILVVQEPATTSNIAKHTAATTRTLGDELLWNEPVLADHWQDLVNVRTRLEDRIRLTPVHALDPGPFALWCVNLVGVEPTTFKTAIYIGSQYKVILVLHEIQQLVVAFVGCERPTHIIHMLRIQGPLGSLGDTRVPHESHTFVASRVPPLWEPWVRLCKVSGVGVYHFSFLDTHSRAGTDQKSIGIVNPLFGKINSSSPHGRFFFHFLYTGDEFLCSVGPKDFW
mmetsp:Transcript_47256/g.115410  ORF Transcript_47256/g.115410 Transcript_47256/m.115410 type:complete len:330 (-) Transcript_47256:590-1579(-)